MWTLLKSDLHVHVKLQPEGISSQVHPSPCRELKLVVSCNAARAAIGQGVCLPFRTGCIAALGRRVNVDLCKLKVAERKFKNDEK